MMLVRLPLLLFVLLICVACEKKPAPYFPFVAADQEWLQAQENEEWVFENPQGRRLRFRLTTVRIRKKAPMQTSGVFNTIGVACYFDDFQFSVVRTDSFSHAGNFIFRSIPEVGDERSTRGLYVVSNEWQHLVGTSLPNGRMYCQQLGFEGDAHQLPATPLTIRGRRYDHVLQFGAGPNIHPYCYQNVARPAMTQVWYDRRAGIVQMQAVNGDLWERLP